MPLYKSEKKQFYMNFYYLNTDSNSYCRQTDTKRSTKRRKNVLCLRGLLLRLNAVHQCCMHGEITILLSVFKLEVC